ncbi:MAG: hypothetical protein E7050_04575 [Lentisphaerae bacterium]|nr:hypothetical protein [Lentisphaerota bacterium]
MKKLLSTLFCTVSAWAVFAAPAPAKPYWADNKLGYEALGDDYIDPDHTPLMIYNATVTAGNKKMVLTESALPKVSAWKDYQILRAPAYFTLNGKKIDAGKLEISKTGKNAVLAKSTFTVDGVKFEVSAKFDFDFTIRYNVKLTPVNKSAVINSLQLVFPMNTSANEEKLVMYYREGPDRLESGLEAQKRRAHLTVKGGDTRKIEPGFSSLFWVGTTFCGMSWNFPSGKAFHVTKGNEMVYDPVSGDFTLNLIEKAWTLDKELVLEFYLTPTPVKNMPKNWRTWNYNWRGAPNQKIDRSLIRQLIWWSSIWRGGAYNPLIIRNPEEVKAAALADKGMNKANYYIPQLVSPSIMYEDDEGNVYAMHDPYLEMLSLKYQRLSIPAPPPLDFPDDTVYFKNLAERNATVGPAITPNKKFTERARTLDVVFAPPVADHLVYALNEFIKLGVGGIYYDGINPQHTYADWAAWTDDDGEKRPVFHFEWQRQLFKRMRYLVKKADPNEMVTAHQSGTRPASTLSLCDVIIPGETFHYIYHEPVKRDASPSSAYYYAHVFGDIDNLKGELFYRQWGVPHLMIPEVTSCLRHRGVKPEVTKGTRTFLAYTLHFDMLYHQTMCDVNELVKIYRIRDAYGMADTLEEYIEFIPYWENNTFNASDKNVKVSYYDKVKEQELYTSYDIRKRYMVIVSNLQFGDAKFTVSLPKGIRKAKVKDMQTGKEIAVNKKANNFECSLAAYDFTILEVTGELDDGRGHW